MSVILPVVSEQNGIFKLILFRETEAGTFRRTGDEPLRLLHDKIAGLGLAEGELISRRYDREERRWRTPTVTFSQEAPRSLYRFLRDKVKQRRIYVFSKTSLNGHLSRFDVHELRLKPNASNRVHQLVRRKYVEVLNLRSEDDLADSLFRPALAG